MKNEKIEIRHTLHTFASPARPTNKPKLAKECNHPSTNTNFEKKLIYA